MSEQSLTDFTGQVPSFADIQHADWGREVNPEQGEQPTGGEINAGDSAGDVGGAEPDRDQARELALERGWVPEADWKGPKERWVDHSAFNDRWEQVLPVVQKENKRLHESLKTALAEIDTLRKSTQGVVAKEAERELAQRAVRTESLRMELKSALENGDIDSQMRINDQLLDLKVEERLNGQPKSAPPQMVDPAAVRVLQEFANDNPVFVQDKDLESALAEQIVVMRAAKSPLVGRELMDKAAERVRRMYPERFQRNGNAEPIQRRHPIGETGFAPTGTRVAPGRSWNDLKPEVREALDKFVRTTPGATREGILKSAGPEYFRS